jgi:hypothetical protein
MKGSNHHPEVRQFIANSVNSSPCSAKENATSHFLKGIKSNIGFFLATHHPK